MERGGERSDRQVRLQEARWVSAVKRATPCCSRGGSDVGVQKGRYAGKPGMDTPGRTAVSEAVRCARKAAVTEAVQFDRPYNQINVSISIVLHV